MTPWLGIVGIGEDGLEGLSHEARALVDQAEVLIGGARHLAMLPDDGRERLTWPNPLIKLVEDIVRRRGTKVCVLATGDPLHYGIGVTLARHVPAEEMTIIPGVSAFSLACARLGWALATVETLTLHSRKLESLHRVLCPGAKVLALSNDGATPAAVAEILIARGYGDSAMTVLEHMGGPKEHKITNTAANWNEAKVADLNTIAIECTAGQDVTLLPRVPGLPDDAFTHDGQLTKREVRAATLAALAPIPGQRLWDVGAGCGAIAIEWLRSHPSCRAIAIERQAARIAMIEKNAHNLGTPEIEIIAGEAPAALKDLAPPDAIFIGGGLSGENLVEDCWQALKPGGRLVANAVTLEGEQSLIEAYNRLGGNLTRIAIARADSVGRFTAWRPLRPVTQWAVTKP